MLKQSSVQFTWICSTITMKTTRTLIIQDREANINFKLPRKMLIFNFLEYFFCFFFLRNRWQRCLLRWLSLLFYFRQLICLKALFSNCERKVWIFGCFLQETEMTSHKHIHKLRYKRRQHWNQPEYKQMLTR